MSWTSAIPPLPEEGWQQVLAGHDVAVILFWAEWSPPDLMMGKVLQQVQPEFTSIAFFSYDLDSQSAVEVTDACGVITNPALVCFFNGKRHDSLIGYMKARQLRAELRQWLGAST